MSDKCSGLTGGDTIYFAIDEEVSEAIWDRLREEQEEARLLAHQNQKGAHCPEWLDAQMYPTSARGGYRFCIERGDQCSLKLMCDTPTRFSQRDGGAKRIGPTGCVR